MVTQTIWKNNIIKEAQLTKERINELFCGVRVANLDSRLEELATLEDGFYQIDELNQYFKIKTRVLQYMDTTVREVIFPSSEPSVMIDYLQNLSKRKEEEALGEVLAEITEFDNDVKVPLVFTNGYAPMKKYYHKELKIKDVNWDTIVELYIDGKYETEIHYNEEMNKYAAYDGDKGYGWRDSIKEAVKYYMDECYRYPNDPEYIEPKCSNCNDGGCLYCETHRFL